MCVWRTCAYVCGEYLWRTHIYMHVESVFTHVTNMCACMHPEVDMCMSSRVPVHPSVSSEGSCEALQAVAQCPMCGFTEGSHRCSHILPGGLGAALGHCPPPCRPVTLTLVLFGPSVCDSEGGSLSHPAAHPHLP